MLSLSLIEHVLAAVPGKTIGLVGDLFLDRYFDIDPALDEASVETGLAAWQVTGVRSYPGALGTVLNNLAALGVGRIVPVSLVGDDGEGYELRQALAKLPAVDATHVLVRADRRTPTYAKPMRGADEQNRLDTKNRTPTPAEAEAEILARLEAMWHECAVIVVVDQVREAECGVVTARVRDRLRAIAAERFVLADSRERIALFGGICVKPNARETELLLAQPMPPMPTLIFATDGAAGSRLFVPGNPSPTLVPGYPVRGPVDICGAGDSCSAGIACGMASGLTPAHAAAFGNLVASVTVQQIGVTGTATPAQVRARFIEHQASREND